ncbi:MAG: 50S ribosome-binding GTPase [Planctomycetaceae bacterium]|nr:50S ribosome-binding GTPase [Planctomycetaceae bacterium]
MSVPDLNHLEFLSAIDNLRQQVGDFANRPSDWVPVTRCQSLLKRVLDRVDTLRVRLEAPLIVATFGGTGTGKSSLVNALVGTECTLAGRQRPTTRQPVIVTHPRTDLTALGIPLDDVRVVERESDLLRDVVIVDCPDPDSDEQASSGSNLERLHDLLPHCDVLLYVSTQQKYRSARVSDELLQAAQGCRILFVQTHADLDSDIRDDWRKTLTGKYEVPDLFFVDSNRALQEQQAGQRPTGDMGRLIDLLSNQLGASERVGIRRANVIDLVQVALQRCSQILNEKQEAVAGLESALETQKQRLTQRMAERLEETLLRGRNLWERRLVSEVCDTWGTSPFSSALRTYNGFGSLLSSLSLFRVRSAAQMALLGAVQGIAWNKDASQEQSAQPGPEAASHFGLDDSLLREAGIVIEGHVQEAHFSRELLTPTSPENLRAQAAAVEAGFVSDAAQRVDKTIRELAASNSRWWVRFGYEVMFLLYIAFVLFRMGKNFFYESFILGTDLLSTDFYIAAGLFFVLWTGLLVILFVRRLRTGLQGRITSLVQELISLRLSQGLFPNIDRAVREARSSQETVKALLAEVDQLRDDVAGSSKLGAQKVRIEGAAELCK